MVKTELINALTVKTGLKKVEAERALNTLLEIIGDELAEGHEVNITGFGKFYSKHKEARTGTNPATGEEIQIPACNVVAFKVGKLLKDKVK